ncbi:3'-5' exoribonuclease YhaM [Caloramator mitchellensis]|uniref:3'-5' exoribonuclease YhaM n=1 Tax=Caloramator mitchellensis TaxID=908809 RepID=A0A0R3JR11_CALMK|nr:HD domain-containing protein [Caloramator mitchellensis]KRQ85894.1 3'-5' exoribonuclease YhaM [Caloramator mitchellensis]
MQISVNQKFENVAVVVRAISKKVDQNNKGYYHLQVGIGLKSYDAKIWSDDEKINNEIIPGCIAYISGIARDFKGTTQLHINTIERIFNPSQDLINSILPTGFANENDMVNEINRLIDTIQNPYIKSLLQNIFEHQEVKKHFYKKAAGAEIHHAYIGGLAQHTIEVAKIVKGYCEIFSYIKYDVAMASALLHDIGKIFELSSFPENKYTTRGRMLGHITLGYEFVSKLISEIKDFPTDIKLDIQHCILSHHGMLEMASPVVPMTIEAIAVHNADKASSEINGFNLAIQRDTGTDLWTEYSPAYKRYIKK